MVSLRHWKAALAIAACCGCGTPHLVPTDSPAGDGDTEMAKRDGVTLIAARNHWCEDQLSDVSTPLGITIVNESDDTLPVSLGAFALIDERGQIYQPLLPEDVLRQLFGDSVALPPPGSEPPLRAPPPMPDRAPEPPAAPGAPPAAVPPPTLQSPVAPTGEETLAAPLEIILARGHGVGPVAGSGAVRTYRGGPRVGPYPYSYGYRPYGWGFPFYAGYWPYGWWFGPAYIVGPDNPYARYYDPRNLDRFGPEQILEVSLRDAELQPHERMGGLVYFAPAWSAQRVTLRFEADSPGSPPRVLTTRFEITR